MRDSFKTLVGLFLFFSWVAGVVIAEGFWSTLFSIIVPFWAYYLLVEKLLIVYGIV
jgi:hypothetical protein